MSTRKKVTYVGFWGHANIGDEALYLSNARIFSSYQLVPSRWIQHSRITLFGGGTVFCKMLMYTPRNRFNYAFGVGVRNPTFWGEPGPFVIDRIKRFQFRFIGTRGDMSRELLKKWGIDSEVIGDPCLILEPKSYEEKENKLIGVNIGTSLGAIWGGNEKRVLGESIKLCKILKNDGYRPVLIPFWKNDLPYIKNASDAAGISIFKNWTNIQDVLDFIASCHVLIGEKLHSLVFSAATYTPFISIEYRPKCLDFAQAMGFEKFDVKTDEITAKAVMMLFDDLLDNWNDLRDQLVKRVEIYRERLTRSAAKIVSDIESLPDDKWSAPKCWQSLKATAFCKMNAHLYFNANSIWRTFNQVPFRAYTEKICAEP